MAAPPPPPPPPSNATTIGKYIARFRHESPRPRDARATAQRSDFWWLESRRETASASPRRLSRSNDGDSDGGRAPMEWELELLSATSVEEAASVVSVASTEDDTPSASRRDTDGVSTPSPLSLSSSWRAARERDAATRTPHRRSPREQDAAALVDDGFVVLPTDAMDEKAMLAASLEDPELVIQRIRRRLGFQPPSSAAMGYSDASLLSPVYSDGQRRFDAGDDLVSESSYDFASPPAAAMEQAFYDGCDTTGQSSLRLEMSESMENVLTGAADSLVSPAASVESAVALASEASSISLDTREPQVPTEENKPEATEEARVDEVLIVYEDAGGDRLVLREESCDGKASPRDCERSPSTVDSAVEQPITPPQQVMGADKTNRSNSPRRDPRSEPPPSPFSQNDRTQPLPSVVDEAEPREKRSPRLPPLSPARGPVFKPALPITPRSLDAKEPEIPPETSKTLDNLLSFVVQSWGENSFFGGTDSEDGETKSIDSSTTPKKQERASEQPFLKPSITTPVSQDEETTCIPRTSEKSQAPGGGESESKSEPDVPTDDVDSDLEIGDGAVEFASDPVVAMLRDRISMLEDALQRLDSKD